MTTPWGKIDKVPVAVDLQEIMSEEFARELQEKENSKVSIKFYFF